MGDQSPTEPRIEAESPVPAPPQALAAQERATPCGTWMCLRDGGLYYASDCFLRLLGMTLPQARGWGWTARLPPDDAPALQRWRRCIETGCDWRDSHRLNDGEGRTRMLAVDARVLHGEDGRVAGWLGVHLDPAQDADAEPRRRELAAVEAEQRERQRIALRLHNSLQQLLVAADLHAQLVEAHDPSGADHLAQVRSLLSESIHACRDLTAELAPPALTDGGLGPAIEWLGRWMAQHHDLTVMRRLDGAAGTNEHTATVLFETARELLLNVVKHAGVRAADVALHRNGAGVELSVRDNGRGFDAQQVNDGNGLDAGFGLSMLRRRIHALGGAVHITSAPWRGTHVTVRVPQATA